MVQLGKYKKNYFKRLLLLFLILYLFFFLHVFVVVVLVAVVVVVAAVSGAAYKKKTHDQEGRWPDLWSHHCGEQKRLPLLRSGALLQQNAAKSNSWFVFPQLNDQRAQVSHKNCLPNKIAGEKLAVFHSFSVLLRSAWPCQLRNRNGCGLGLPHFVCISIRFKSVSCSSRQDERRWKRQKLREQISQYLKHVETHWSLWHPMSHNMPNKPSWHISRAIFNVLMYDNAWEHKITRTVGISKHIQK